MSYRVATEFNLNTYSATQGDGVADDAPAFIAALTAIKAAGGGILFVPRPKVHWTVATNVNIDFALLSNSIRICGEKGASVIMLATGAGSDAFTLSNIIGCLEVCDLVFAGNRDVTVNPDVLCGLDVGFCNQVHVHDCEFVFLGAGNLGCVRGFQSELLIETCTFRGCGSTKGVVFADQPVGGLVVRDTYFLDPGFLHGQQGIGGSKSSAATNNAWIFVGNPTAYPVRGVLDPEEIYIADSFFDEGANVGVWVLPTTNRYDGFVMHGCVTNVARIGANQIGASVTQVNNVLIKNCWFGYSTSSVEAIALSNVRKAEIVNVDTQLGTSANNFFADNLCGLVILDHSTFNGSVVSQAAVTRKTGQTFQGVAASMGGTFVTDIPVTIQSVNELQARVTLAQSANGLLANAGSVQAKAVVANKAGALALTPALAGSSNPMNSALLLASEPEVADAGFGAITAAWTVVGNGARLTITNPGASNATVGVDVEQEIFGMIAPMDPTSIPGLVAWYRADIGITTVAGAVSAWNTNPLTGDASENLVQAVVGKRPTFVAANAAYNNQPTVHFTRASGQFIASPVWNIPHAQPHTVVIIGNDDGTNTLQFYDSNEQGSVNDVVIANTDTVHNFYSSIAGGPWINTAVPPSSAPHAFIAIYAGAGSQLYVSSNTAGVTGNCGANGRTGMSFGVGTDGATGFLNGDIAEGLVFDHALTTTERNQLNAYINNRYGIAIS